MYFILFLSSSEKKNKQALEMFMLSYNSGSVWYYVAKKENKLRLKNHLSDNTLILD